MRSCEGGTTPCEGDSSMEEICNTQVLLYAKNAPKTYLQHIKTSRTVASCWKQYN